MQLKHIAVAALGVWIAGLAVVFVAVPRADEGLPAASRTLSSRVDAAGLQTVSIAAADGEVSVVTAPDDAISASVEVVAAGRSRALGRRPGNPARLTLDTRTQGNEVTLELKGGAGGAFEERWMVAVPARLAVRVRLHDGRVQVRGIAGGVSVEATSGLGSSPGEIDVEVPSGPMDLNLRVGTIRAATAATAHGDVEVESRVGNAPLFVGGSEVMARRAPGSGHRLRLGPTEQGAPPIEVSVGVGDASLRIR